MKLRAGRNDRAFAMTLVFAVIVVAVLGYVGPRPCVDLVIASSEEKSALLTVLARDFSNAGHSVDGRCAKVTVVRKASGEAEAALAKGWDPRFDGISPDVWAPAAISWTLLLRQHRAARGLSNILPDDAPSLMRSPTVIAMPRKMAQALGWPSAAIGWRDILSLAQDPAGWARYGHPEWERFQLGKTDPRSSTSGFHALIGTYFAAKNRPTVESDVSDPTVRSFVGGVESAVVHYGDTVSNFLLNYRAADNRREALKYVSAVAVQEKQVWDYNHGNPTSDPAIAEGALPPTEELVAVYPSEGTLVAEHPYAVLEAPWVGEPERKLAALFLGYLLSPDVQARLKAAAFRGQDGRLADHITAADGLLPDQPRLTIQPPAPRTLELIQASWSELRKRARIVVAIDVSEGMGASVAPGRSKLDLVKSAAIEALDQLASDDQVGLWIFSTGLAGGASYQELVPVSSLATRGGDLRLAIEKLAPIAGGRTPLFATTRAAVSTVADTFARDRINAVVLLTDDRNEDASDTDEVRLLRELLSQNNEKRVRVFTVGYGADADVITLTRIAHASGGAFYEATVPGSIGKVLRDVLSNF